MRAPRIDIIGAGPGGLYTAILARRHLPRAEVRVIERNARGATFGFGVVFSDQALDFLAVDDPETHRLLTPHLESWRNMKLNLPAGQVTLDGVGFSAIGRLQLLEILEARAADLPVQGLMCVPPLDLEAAPYFALLAKIARDHGLGGLSMGMSGDFETAVTIGATHVRVGTALFGARA